MSIAEIGAMGEAFGSLLILVTLVYLAIQNRQQQKLLLSTVYQSRADTAINQAYTLATNPSVWEASMKAPEGRSGSESIAAAQHFSGCLKLWENVFFQHAIGTLAGDDFTAKKSGLKSVLALHPGMVQYWHSTSGFYNPPYRSWVDEIIQEIEEEAAAA